MSVRRGIATFVILLATLPVAVTATARTVESQGTPVRLEATAGIEGYVDPLRPLEITVLISSDVLFVGKVEARGRRATVQVEVEVPAGGRKTYSVVLPSPATGESPRVRLLADDGSEVLRQTVRTQDPSDRILVGVVGAAGLDRTLATIRSPITSAPVTALDLDALPAGSVRPLAYMVVGGELSITDGVRRWVESGGRMVVEADITGSFDGPEALGPVPGIPGSGWFRIQRGDVIEVPSVSALSAAQWQTILRPVPLVIGARDEWQNPERPLMQAASNTGDQQAPSLPWLAGALAVYVVVVGPLNFWVLRRRRLRDAAWLTIPALSLLAVTAFWLAGRPRLDSTSVSHASVFVAGDDLGARSAIVLGAGGAGTHRVSPPDGWVIYPSDVSADVGPVAGAVGTVDASGDLVFQLPQLGVAAMQTLHPVTEAVVPLVTVAGQDISVSNTTGVEFWGWGVSSGSGISVGDGPLPPGETRTVRAQAGGQFGFEFGGLGEAVVNRLGIWDDSLRPWETVFPLGETVGWLEVPTPYVFGFSRDLPLEVTIDGSSRSIMGESLVIIPVHTLSDGGATSIEGQLVGAPDSPWFDRGPGFLMVQTTEMTLQFRVPDPVVPHLEFVPGPGEIPNLIEAWDFDSGQFVAVGFGEPLDRGRFVDPAGDVFVRVSNAGNEFQEELPMSPASFRMTWSTA